MRDIQPIHDRVLLKRIASKEVSSGGIIIPENAKERPQIAVVVAVGPGKNTGKVFTEIPEGVNVFTPGQVIHTDIQPVRQDMLVKPGDVVLFGKYSGQDFDFDGETYLFVLEQEILGVFENYKEN